MHTPIISAWFWGHLETQLSDFKNSSYLDTTVNLERYLPTTAKREQSPFLFVLLLHKTKPCPWYYKGLSAKFCKFKTLSLCHNVESTYPTLWVFLGAGEKPTPTKESLLLLAHTADPHCGFWQQNYEAETAEQRERIGSLGGCLLPYICWWHLRRDSQRRETERMGMAHCLHWFNNIIDLLTK